MLGTVVLTAVILTAVGLGLIWKREEAAELQSGLAGGRIRAGCVAIEGVGFVVLAVAIYVAWRMGAF